MIDEGERRGRWKMTEVVKTCVTDDDLVQVVDVRCADRNVLKRPITELILLVEADERSDICLRVPEMACVYTSKGFTRSSVCRM